MKGELTANLTKGDLGEMITLGLAGGGGRRRGILARLKLGHVQFLVNNLGHWFNICMQFLFDVHETKAVLVRYEVDG